MDQSSLQVGEMNSGYLHTRREGLHYLNCFWEASGNQNRPQEARSKGCSCDLMIGNCYRDNWLQSFLVLVSFHLSFLVSFLVSVTDSKERILFAEPQFYAHLFSRETRPAYRHLVQAASSGRQAGPQK